MPRLIVGVSAASGSIYAIQTLRALRAVGVHELHLVTSPHARQTVKLETGVESSQLDALADVVHDSENLTASISSGSFNTDGMVVVPCSMRSASAIADSLNDSLLVRAADVCLQEHRTLVLVVRETPLQVIHLRSLARVAEAGAVILPPVPETYPHPKTIEDVVNDIVGKILNQFSIDHDHFDRWRGGDENRLGSSDVIRPRHEFTGVR